MNALITDSGESRTFYFLRHGETNWNVAGKIQGQHDVPLNANGERQARKAASVLKHAVVDVIISSPLKRARDTAKVVSSITSCDIVVVEDIKECCWGDREGKNVGDWMKDWRSGAKSPNGAESFSTFKERTYEAITGVLSQYRSPLIVAHTGTYWVIQWVLLGDDSLEVPKPVPLKYQT